MKQAEEKISRLEKANVRCDKLIQDLLPPGVTYGYLGNCDIRPGGPDYREWFIFLPHPDRVGTASDRIGGYRTQDRRQLLSIAATLATGYKLGRGEL